MNNLSEKQRDAKQAHLDNQQAQMIARYENADQSERAAIIRQIDGFLPTLKGDEKAFWLSFRQKLERLGEAESKKIFRRCNEYLEKIVEGFAADAPENQADFLTKLSAYINTLGGSAKHLHQVLFESLVKIQAAQSKHDH